MLAKEGIHFRIICDNNFANKTTISLFNSGKIPNVELLVPVKKSLRVQDKFCLVDDNILIEGTANYSDRAFFDNVN